MRDGIFIGSQVPGINARELMYTCFQKILESMPLEPPASHKPQLGPISHPQRLARYTFLIVPSGRIHKTMLHTRGGSRIWERREDVGTDDRPKTHSL